MTGITRPVAHAASRAETLAATGQIGEAFRLLTSADADPDALFMLASWRISGQFVRRDLAASRSLLCRAADIGHVAAIRTAAAFMAGGVGGSADWPGALRMLERLAAHDPEATKELDCLARMRLSSSGEPPPPPPEEPLSARPYVRAFRSLFTPEECDFIVMRALPWLGPALVVDPRTGRQMRNPIRTSDGMAFPYVVESPAIHAFNKRIAAISSSVTAQGEPLQVLRYRCGQEYRPHSDALTGEANQRILTVLVYLNEDFDGGETVFVRTGLKFRGRKGDALLFRNALPDGRADDLAQHAGLPVTGGEKLICSRWIRAEPFSVPAPRPMLDI